MGHQRFDLNPFMSSRPKAQRPDRRREIIDPDRQDWQMTIRRACSALCFNRSAYHYKSRRADPAVLKKRIKKICETHVRYGYRRVYYILRRDGWAVNMKKVYRLYTYNCATSHRSRRSCVRTVPRSGRTMRGLWTSFTTNWRQVASYDLDSSRYVLEALAGN